MVDINKLKQQAKEAAEKGLVKDQSKDTGGDFKYEPPAAGVCYGRIISYIEIGNHAKENDKFGKGAQPYAIVQFELFGKKHAKEIEVDGVKKTIYPIITERLNISTSKKSWFYKLMHALDYGRGNTHMAFMVGEAFKFNVIHVEQERDGKKVVFANIRKDGWLVSAPVMEVTSEDGDVETKPVRVPEPTAPLRLFLWDSPTQEMWDSIFIDGTNTREVDGKEVEVSRNRHQNDIIAADNFGGSAVEAMLASTNGGLPKTQDTRKAAEEHELDEGEGEVLAEDTSEAPPADEDDPLAGLDLPE